MSQKVKILPKENNMVEYIGSWNDLDSGEAVLISDPYYYSKGEAIVANSTTVLANGDLSTSGLLREGIHFEYGKRLDASVTEDPEYGFGTSTGGIYDVSTSTGFASGKCIRLLENGKNVKDSSGLNLKIFAWDSLRDTEKWSPKGDRIYVDPIEKVVLFPRPDYWSKCLSWASFLEAAELKNNKYSPYFLYSANSYESGFSSGKFGDSYYSKGVDNGHSILTLYPFGRSDSLSFYQGTISFWFYGEFDAYFENTVSIEVLGAFHAGKTQNCPGNFSVLVGSGIAPKMTFEDQTWSWDWSGNWHHIFLTWDSSGSLATGVFGRCFVDGVLKFESFDTDINYIGTPKLVLNTTMNELSALTNLLKFDNIKVWRQCITSPTFEYNGGVGYPEAYHPIYFLGNSYVPTDIKSGYYYMKSNSKPAKLPAPEEDGLVELELPANYEGGIGYFGRASSMKNSSYEDLIKDTDYAYNQPLDGSGTTPDIYDDSASGAFEISRYMRICHNGKNITNITGLNLTPIAKDLTNFSCPSITQAYIDPGKSKFILPGPLFWSKTESHAGILAGVRGTSTIINSPHQYVSGYYNNCMYNRGDWVAGPGGINSHNTYITSITPQTYNLPKGSVLYKIWITSWREDGNSSYDIRSGGFGGFGGNCTTTSSCPYEAYGGVGDHVFDTWGFGLGQSVYYLNSPPNAGTSHYGLAIRTASTLYGYSLPITLTSGNGVWFTVFGIWDSSKSLTGGKSVRVWAIAENGTSYEVSTSESINTNNLHFSLSVSNWYGWIGYHVWSYVKMDNIKVWSDVITEDPSVVYGFNESSLHTIYGSYGSYQPLVDIPHGGGVGYYRSGGTGTYARWTI